MSFDMAEPSNPLNVASLKRHLNTSDATVTAVENYRKASDVKSAQVVNATQTSIPSKSPNFTSDVQEAVPSSTLSRDSLTPAISDISNAAFLILKETRLCDAQISAVQDGRSIWRFLPTCYTLFAKSNAILEFLGAIKQVNSTIIHGLIITLQAEMRQSLSALHMDHPWILPAFEMIYGAFAPSSKTYPRRKLDPAYWEAAILATEACVKLIYKGRHVLAASFEAIRNCTAYSRTEKGWIKSYEKPASHLRKSAKSTRDNTTSLHTRNGDGRNISASSGTEQDSAALGVSSCPADGLVEALAVTLSEACLSALKAPAGQPTNSRSLFTPGTLTTNCSSLISNREHSPQAQASFFDARRDDEDEMDDCTETNAGYPENGDEDASSKNVKRKRALRGKRNAIVKAAAVEEACNQGVQPQEISGKAHQSSRDPNGR